MHVHQRMLSVLVGLLFVSACTTEQRLRAATGPTAAATAQAVLAPTAMDVWLLDVGQGSCAYIACPDERSALVIDCGSSAAGGTALPAISAWISAKLAAADMATVVISHPDKDHMSLFSEEAIAPALVTQLLIGRAIEEYPEKFQQLAAQVTSRPHTFGPAEVTMADPRVACGPAQADVLTANSTMDDVTGTFGGSKNADSAVIRLRHGATAVIFTGDAEGETEQSAIDNAAARNLSLDRTTLLLGSHHGARTAGSNSRAWLEATRPQAIAYSARLASGYHHPQCAVVDRALGSVETVSTAFAFPCGEGSAATVQRTVDDLAPVLPDTAYRLNPAALSPAG